MKIFIDFDDVIFNTKQFKSDLAEVFFKHGISKDLYEKSYYDPNDKRSIRTYDPRAQILRIKNGVDVDEYELLNGIKVFMEDASKYVFKDFFSFVKKYDQKNVYVVSYGDIKFQEEKINSSGIKKYIDNIFIGDRLKSVMVENFLEKNKNIQEEKIFFIDDRIEQIQDVKKKTPNIVTMFLKRPEGRYQKMIKDEYCDFEVHNLQEAQEAIEKILKPKAN